MTELQNQLFSLQDKKYKAFQEKLIPTVNPDTIIGVRIPVLRALSKDFQKHPDCALFLSSLPHQFLEENLLHMIILSNSRDFQEWSIRIQQFLPYVDNWSVNDIGNPRYLKKYSSRLLSLIQEFLQSNRPYTLRFGLLLLMCNFLDKNFKAEYLELAAHLTSDEYYVNMMLAWFFATALCKHWNDTIKYLQDKKLPVWVHNKTIQKAVESFRITPEQKTFLKTLKIKA